ncbi:response regulator transcription factor [Paenibacillus apiarius]|uniref:Response regulator n=1 Tax=Paenibacillus apiarius TaxID=46240 RepID=A0ABT4DPR6_9BACL|nr:response regulator [Paenibacillus apiarius]MCY9517354.1 response regulator [Paenibacillus apiarius]MCY9518775.1 response regulator [Paenibacillus apiarius]MCY9552784.1 response regulator [Paenibacillus apiarius]MCY9556809.1 response regulator [Paenibacillus apiarius]MCY9684292.1 response regulator [Paenibacillus apiarius]
MSVKALLIDDEIHILNNLKMVIPWEELAVEIVGMARNGAEGLDIVRQRDPDLILCDIRMPVMDGMEFLREVRKMGSEAEVMMLTGYQEFEYARIALQHGVRDYILKPINYEELEQTVRTIANLVRSRKQEKNRSERRWGKVISLAYEKMMFDVLMGFSAGTPPYVIADDGLQADQLDYALLLIDLDGYVQHTVSWSDNERKLWNFAVRNVLQDAISDERLEYAVLQMREGEWCVLMQYSKERCEVSQEDMARWARSFQRAVREHVKLTVSLAWDKGPIQLACLANTYKRLQRSLVLYPDDEQLVQVDEGSNARQAASVSEWQLVEDIVSGMKQNDKGKVEKSLQSLQSGLLLMPEQSVMRVEKFLHYVIIHLLREMRELELVSSQEEETMWNRLQHSVSVKDLNNLITQLINHTKEHAMNKKSSELLMISAKDYIHRNLSSDIGIDEISDYLGISCSYFSLLFKTHFGETFVEYVTKQRMNLAKSMLRMTDKSITQIGASVGYSERRYFSKVFQKYTGITPSEFREQPLSAEHNHD